MPAVFNDSILPATADSDVSHMPAVFNDSKTEPNMPYSKPVELIRKEEYPHMNQGPTPPSR